MAGSVGDDDRPVFDDDFVNSAILREPPWGSGPPVGWPPPPSGPLPPPQPPSRRPGRAVAAVFLVAVMVGVGCVLVFWNGRSEGGVKYDEDGSVVTTEPGVPVKDVPIGGCVVWPQPTTTRSAKPTTVSCDQPHFVEMLGARPINLPSDDYPTDAVADAYEDRVCTPLAIKHLGYPLYRYGRFQVGSFFPSKRGWEKGDRTLHCDLQHIQVTKSENERGFFHAFTGKVAGQDQNYVHPTGSCVLMDSKLYGSMRTTCDDDYDVRVTGRVDLRRLPDPPRTRVEANLRATAACAAVTMRFLGGPLPPGATSGAFELFEPDWTLGDRVTNCYWRR